MSAEANVATLQELLDRVQRNRLKLAQTRSRAAEIRPEVPAKETPISFAAPIAAAPVMPEPAVAMPDPEVAMPEPAVAMPEPAVVMPEPEAELEPLPDEPALTVSEPFEEPALTASEPFEEPALTASEPFEGIEAQKIEEIPPVAAAAPPELAMVPDISPRTFKAEIEANGPVASVSGHVETTRAWTVAAVLSRAWKLGG